MSDVSNLDLLEQKITKALEKINLMRVENQSLQKEKQVLERRLEKISGNNQSLQKSVAKLEANLKAAEKKQPGLEAIKGRVDGILAKFEQLDL